VISGGRWKGGYDFGLRNGHEDHTADAAAIANRCQATLVANYEIRHVVREETWRGEDDWL